MRSILYITYDGLTDSLGQSQILPYLKRLNKLENEIVILSFEKEALFEKEGSKVKAIVEASGLKWVPLRYTKRPPVLSTVYDINKGYKACRELHAQHNCLIVHCRGYISAIIGRRLQKTFGVKCIFDMRGWWPDEKLESGLWNKKIYKPVYRYFKKLEKEFFAESNYIVSLTYKGKKEIEMQGLASANKIGVIPTCVDFEIFKAPDDEVKQQMRAQLGIAKGEKVFVYSGSVGGNYDPDILISVFEAYKKLNPESFLLILSKEHLTDELRRRFSDAGIERIGIYNAPFTEVTNYLRAGEVGFIYYKMSFSVIGRSPTKMGEYWASGIPVIAFSGIGDLDHIVEKYPGSGLLLSSNQTAWEAQLKDWLPADAETLRNYALDYFHVDKGVKFYQDIYERLDGSKVHEQLTT
jgi:glycosyltransferase involved in cell wall biosynthesis